MSEQAVLKAKKSVKEILDTLGIQRVICVDDEYKDAPDVEEVLAHAAGLKDKVLRRILPQIGKVNLKDPEIRNTRIREVWNGMDEADQTAASDQILVEARREHYTGAENDAEVAAILHRVIPDGCLVPLSPEEWDRRKDALLAENATIPTLFLFDNDLGAAIGGENGGMRIISSLLVGYDSIICGLLTHTVSPADQFERWKSLSEAFGADQDRFVPIPKQYLYDTPGILAQMLKFVALAPQFSALKRETKLILESAQAEAVKKVEEIRVHDLNHMVFRVSNEEGTWEPEMLFRLHGLFHRLEARRLAHEGGKLERLIDRLRSVSGIPTDGAVPRDYARRVAQLERFESGDFVNANHLPLDLGDIFESDDGGRFVLVAPICDLMVRSKGKRGPEIPRLTLLTLSKVEEAGTGSSTRSNRDAPSDYELDHMGVDANERWVAKFKWARFVTSSVLDICVFNSDGRAKFTLASSAPNGLRPAWRKRHEVISKEMNLLNEQLVPFEPVPDEPAATADIKARSREALIAHLMNEGVFKGTHTTDEQGTHLTYGIRRIDRLSRSRAVGLLAAYTAFLARPAYDVDFDKD